LSLDRRTRQAYPSADAWLTLDSRWFIEARRLEGLIALVAGLVAPVRAPTRRRRARTACR
jgi:hypothetical protein